MNGVIALVISVALLAWSACFPRGRAQLNERLGTCAILAAANAAVLLALFYVLAPSGAGPLWGTYGLFFLVEAFSLGIALANLRGRILVSFAAFFLVLAGLFASVPLFRAQRFVELAGPVEVRTWEQDSQPANPEHIRLVPRETALQIAKQQLSGGGSVGSQFEIGEESLHIQRIRGRLWWVAPLDYRGFTSWTATDGSPGYILVDAENRHEPPVFRRDLHLRYMPEAFFGHDLERHLRANGYWDRGLTDFTFEVDDNDRPWWVVTVYEPTIGWSGDAVQGVLTVDPETGAHRFYRLDEVPAWIDRVMPRAVVKERLDWRGELAGGWLNSFWGQANVTNPAGDPRFTYGDDGEPYWVTQMTSNNANDTTMVELVYTNARTGRHRVYRVRGGTEAAVLERVDNVVKFMHFHGADPVFYNVRGALTAVVPVLGESHTFQEVALVSVANASQQIAHAPSFAAALRSYEQLLAQDASSQAAVDVRGARATVTAAVRRIGLEPRGSETLFSILVEGHGTVFTASGELSPLLPLTRDGDQVLIEHVPGTEPVVTMLRFQNLTLS